MARLPRLALRIALWTVGGSAVLVVLLVGAAITLNTGPGRAFVAARLAGLDVAGLHLHIGRIDGSLYGRMVLRNAVVTDRKGVVATSPAVVLDWEPAALVQRRVVVDELSSRLVRLLRSPVLKPPAKSSLPTLGYTVKRLAVSRLVLEPAVAPRMRSVSLVASVDATNGSFRLNAEARARRGAGGAGGDVALVALDAEPKQNRLRIAVRVFGPRDGVLDGLLGLGAPIAFEVTGRGDWRDWRGAASAAVGGQAVLNAALGAHEGRFTAAGTAEPGRVFTSLAKFTGPATRFDIAASAKGTLFSLQGRLASAEFSAQVAGGVDLKQKVLQGVRVDATLLDPSALSPRLGGRNVRLRLTVDGPFARPLVDYDFTADTLAYGKITARDVAAHGRSVREADGAVRLPISLTAESFAGFSKTAGPLTTLALSGPVTIRRDGAVSADLTLRSRRLSFHLELRGSERTATYAGALRAKLDTAAVEALGLESALGGGATLSADIASSRPIPLQLSDLRLSSPLLRITRGRAAYGADGRIALAASVVSAKYGAAQVTAGGALDAIHAHLSAPNPKLPGRIDRIEADLNMAGAAGTYRLAATAGSPYGPLTLNATVRTSGGVLSLLVNRAQLMGLTLAGAVMRSAAGPFTGVLAVGGDGLSGAIRLTAHGSAKGVPVQAASVRLQAADARLPLAEPISVRSGRFAGAVTLYPGAPEFEGQASLADVSRGGATLTRVRADASYRDGAGRADFALAGGTRVGFQFAGNARLTPGRVLIEGKGALAGVRLRLAQPAQATRQGAVWRLAPATILTSDGRLVVSGAYGNGASLSARLEQVNLRLVRAFKPGLDVGGRASGQADFNFPKGGGSPSGRLALAIVGLTDTGATTVSAPLDVDVLGDLAGPVADVRAAVRQGGVVIGRLQVRATLPAQGGFSERLRAARVSGGARYEGRAGVLVALTGMAGQQLNGSVTIGVDVSGQLQRPQLRGVLLGRDLDYRNAGYGTHITDIAVQGRFVGTRFDLIKLTGATVGDGRISASGYADLSLANGLRMDLSIKLEHAQLAHSDTLGAKLGGTLTVTDSRQNGGLVSGALTVDSVHYQVSRPAAAQVADLRGVHWKGQPLAAAKTSTPSGPPSYWRLDVRVSAGSGVFVNGLGLASEWRADLVVDGDTTHPRIVGDVRSVRGTYSFGGRQLTLGDSDIHFDGSTPPDPTLDINASATVNSVTATIDVTGTAVHPEIAFTSTPAMPQDEVLSQFLFGGSSAQLSPLQGLQLAASLNALRGGAGALGALGKLSRATGLQDLRFQGANSQTGQGPSIGAGKYVTSNVYVDVLTDARGYTATQVQVALTRAFSLLSEISTFGATSGSVQYIYRY